MELAVVRTLGLPSRLTDAASAREPRRYETQNRDQPRSQADRCNHDSRCTSETLVREQSSHASQANAHYRVDFTRFVGRESDKARRTDEW